jgi:CheY-specific phosphatase CheX
MNNTWKTALLRVAALTFEDLCFLFPETDLTEEQQDAPVDATVCVRFQGRFSGTLQMTLSGQVLPMVAANMLGEEEATTSQQLDALGEIANIICGNFLPHVAGSHAVFHIDAPQVVDATDSMASASMACMTAGQLGLEQGRVDLRLWIEPAGVASLREKLP